MRILKAKVCVECGKEFMPRTNSQITCNEECRKKRKRKTEQNWRSGKKLTSLNKPLQTVEDIMKIGREHGIYSYGKIVQAIERGEIE